jgi:hypothetical protein
VGSLEVKNMLVMLAGDQLLAPRQICQTCLLADSSGEPRWHNGQLKCGSSLPKPMSMPGRQYECPMGFRIVAIDE